MFLELLIEADLLLFSDRIYLVGNPQIRYYRCASVGQALRGIFITIESLPRRQLTTLTEMPESIKTRYSFVSCRKTLNSGHSLI